MLWNHNLLQLHKTSIGHSGYDTSLRDYGFLVTGQGDVLLMDQDEPETYSEAMMGPKSEEWLKAMRSEMDSMYTNQVWNMVKLPEGVRPIGCKWIFKKKIDMDGIVHTYKARLVAKGYK